MSHHTYPWYVYAYPQMHVFLHSPQDALVSRLSWNRLLRPLVRLILARICVPSSCSQTHLSALKPTLFHALRHHAHCCPRHAYGRITACLTIHILCHCMHPVHGAVPSLSPACMEALGSVCNCTALLLIHRLGTRQRAPSSRDRLCSPACC